MALPPTQTSGRMTLEEYLRTEELSEVKREFHDGEVLAMSGGTTRHARISTTLNAMLYNRLRRGPCRSYDSNARVATAETRRFVYPDASIVCGPIEYLPVDKNRTTILNPRVVFEVLSESTERYDRGEKFRQYARISTLEEYVLVRQDEPLVEGFLRQPDGTWSMAPYSGLDAVARVRCLGIDLPLAELYEGVDFDEARAESA